MRGSGLDETDLDDELLINTKFENIEKLKFDDQKWEIDPKKFIITENSLGEGNFGRVFLAYVSLGEPLRDDDEVERDFQRLANNTGSSHPDAIAAASSRLKNRFSLRRNHNTYIVNNDRMELAQPLLNKKMNKDTRPAAVKMVKGKLNKVLNYYQELYKKNLILI